MKLFQLNEDVNERKPELVRSRADFKSIKKMGGGSPEVSDIVMVVKDDSDEIIGYMITKPYRETAYTKKYGVAEGHDDLVEDLLIATLEKCKEYGFKHCTNRTTDSKLKKLLQRIYGDPHKVQKFKHKTAHRFKVDLKEIGEPNRQRVHNGGSDYDSSAPRYSE